MSELNSNDPPMVSIILPVYNGARFLAESLESAVAQTYPHFEIVVMDDGSIDDSAAIAQSFPRVRYWYQENAGIAAARNAAMKHAAGELIAFLDHDDLWAANKLELQVKYLQAHPEVGLVLANERLFFSNGYTSPFWLNHQLMQSDHLGLVPGTWLLRKSVFEQVGPLNPRFRISDDVDWFMRFLDLGFQYGVVEETLLFKRMHGENASFQIHAAMQEILAAFRASIHRRRDSGMTRTTESTFLKR
jgi:glycosyltransferase involved in cell wall biosynthesis